MAERIVIGDKAKRGRGTLPAKIYHQIQLMVANSDIHEVSQNSTTGVPLQPVKMNWWEASGIPNVDSHFHQGWANTAMALQAIAGGNTALERFATASLKDGDKLEAWLKRFGEEFPSLRLVQEDVPVTNKSSDSDFTFVDPNNFVLVEYDNDAKISLNVSSRDREMTEKLLAWFKENTTTTIPAGRVHVLVTTKEGPEFQSMGVGEEVLERGNYTNEVLKGYDRIVSDLTAEDPAGRLAVLNGPPGCGKTYIIRGLLHDVEDAIMVIVPANMVAEMCQPNMIPALVNLHKERGEKPMVFIIEDADEVLAPRMSDNMSSVSSLLNLGDGILGQLLDVRIVCTTNARVEDMDEAVKRPGRLSAFINVGHLPYDKAKEIFERLAPGKELVKKKYTLAEIYQQARDDGWVPPPKKKSVGFTSEED